MHTCLSWSLENKVKNLKIFNSLSLIAKNKKGFRIKHYDDCISNIVFSGYWLRGHVYNLKT